MPSENLERNANSDPDSSQSRYEYLLIVENNDTEQFIHKTLVRSLGLAHRIEHLKSGQEALSELKSAERLSDVPDLIFLSLHPGNEKNADFLDRFSGLPDFIRAKCKLVIVTPEQTREEKQRTIMNPSVIRYLEKPVDFAHLKDFMFM